MIAPASLQMASIMAVPEAGACLYQFDGQILWLPYFKKKGKK